MKTGIPTIGHAHPDDNGNIVKDAFDDMLIMEFRDELHPAAKLRDKFKPSTVEDCYRVKDFIKSLGFDRL